MVIRSKVQDMSNEDLRLFNEGLTALFNTFSIVLEDTNEGKQALEAVNEALSIIGEVLNPPESNDMPTSLRTALEQLTYSVTESFNGDAFHIIDAHLRTTFDDLTLNELVMTLNMCRIVKAGKESRLTLAQRAEIVTLHPDFTAGKNTKKAQREALSEIEKSLEDKHGKYASKATLVKTKFDTSTSYTDEWIDKVTSFADSVFEAQLALEEAPEIEIELSDEPLEELEEVTPQGGEVEAYIDHTKNERVAYDAKGREWRTEIKPVSPLDLFMKK